jgi:spore coat protein U-like protein
MRASQQLNRRRWKLKYACALLLVGALSDLAQAATTTSTFTVQMTVTSSCVINSASTLNFGSQGVLVANVDNTSTVQVQCTNTTPYNIGLDAGTGSGATVTTRKMTKGGVIAAKKREPPGSSTTVLRVRAQINSGGCHVKSV